MPRMIQKPKFIQTVQENFSSYFNELFDLPICEKIKHFNVNCRGLAGYFPLKYEITETTFGFESKEYWHICRSDHTPEGSQSYYPKNSWPDHLLHSFRVFEEIFLGLEATIEYLILEYSRDYELPLDYLAFSEGNHVLRLVCYHPNKDGQILAVPLHKDRSLFTISIWDSDGAMQILDSHENWVDTRPLLTAMNVLEGSILERISGERIVATNHRVKAVFKTPRYALLLFVHPPPDFVIRSLPNQSGYISPPILCKNYLSNHAKELGIRRSYSHL